MESRIAVNFENSLNTYGNGNGNGNGDGGGNGKVVAVPVSSDGVVAK